MHQEVTVGFLVGAYAQVGAQSPLGDVQEAPIDDIVSWMFQSPFLSEINENINKQGLV